MGFPYVDVFPNGDFIVSNDNMIGRNNGTTTLLAADTTPTEIQGTNINLDAPVTSSGAISSSGDIMATNFRVPGTLASTGYWINALSTGKPTINANSNVLILGAAHSSYTGQGVKIYSSGSGEGLKIDAPGNITASGNISSSGNLIGIIDGGKF